MIEIEIKDNKQVEFALEELKKTVHHDVFQFSLCRNILLFSIDIKGIKKIEDKFNLLLASVSRFQKYTSHSIEDFKKAILEEIEARKRSQPEIFHIIFYLNIERSSIEKKRFFTIRGNKLFSRTYSFINRHFDFKKFASEARPFYLEPQMPFRASQFQPFECIVSGRNAGEAFWKAFDIFELFRTILNFSNNFCVISFQSGGRTHLNTFLPSPFCLVYNSKKEYIHFRYELNKYKYKNFNRPSSHFRPKVFELLLKIFRNEYTDESMEGIILESLYHYGKALDSLDWETNFLKLWRILELITFYSEESTIKLTGSRVKLLFNQTLQWNYAIDSLCLQRNQLVHKGNFPEEGLDELCILKFIVENAIWILISMRKDFEDKASLRMFYENAFSASGDLRKKVSVIKKILISRK